MSDGYYKTLRLPFTMQVGQIWTVRTMDLVSSTWVTTRASGWEDLDHSHAGREFEAFHDLSDEMYTLTGK